MTAGTLPVPPTALIGRLAELTAVRDRLMAPGNRLVTLTGPPGVGKTRLALSVAHDVAPAFPSGLAWVDLAPVREPRLVLHEIARALGVSEHRTDLQAELVGALANRPVLVVLDNCEHLLDSGAELAELLESCPSLRMLATSRERLRLIAEQEYAVPPLPMPSEDDVSDMASLAANPSIALLTARAPAHVPLTARSARAFADICVRLDGLPLAIELAAARLRVFTPAELAFRLEHSMALLTGGSRDSPVRHRDLRAAVTWSHDLLSDLDRAVFRRLSVFVSSWTLDAAQAVCAEADAADAVESLLEKSLIQRAHSGSTDARFSMLVSLREFAAEQLVQHDEVDASRARHIRYFAEESREWEATVGTNDETATWPLVGVLRDDLRAAFEASRLGTDTESTLWLSCALGWYWYTRGQLTDAPTLIDTLHAAADMVSADADVLPAALIAAGIVEFGLGDLDSAQIDLTRAFMVSERSGNKRRMAIASAFLGNVSRDRGSFAEAAEHHQLAREIFQQTGNTRGVAWAAHDLGLLAAERGDLSSAGQLLRDALALFDQTEYVWAVAVTSTALAGVLLREGALDEPARLLGEALALHASVDDHRNVARCFELLAEVALGRGSPATAARMLGAAAAMRGAVSAWPNEAATARTAQLEQAISRILGVAATEHEQHAGRTMSGTAALALGRDIVAVGADAGKSDDVELTSRQREVAALVAASRTNRQIGAALGISEKTAEVHVRNIMERLHTTSRAGVAAWAATHGLRVDP